MAWTLAETTDGITHWATRPHVPGSLRETLAGANILLVPQEGFRGDPRPVFPNGTQEFFEHLRERKPDAARVEIAIGDDDYRELALHADLLIIAGAVVTGIAFPVFASMIYDYIKNRLGSSDKKTDLRMDITLQQTIGVETRAIRLTYDGPSREFAPSLEVVMEQLRQRGFDPTAGHGNTKTLPGPGLE